jgi:hypothetical protein
MEYVRSMKIILFRSHNLIKCANDAREYDVKYFVFFLKYIIYILKEQIR